MLGALIPLQTLFYFSRMFYKPDELVSTSFPMLPFLVILQRLVALQVKEQWTLPLWYHVYSLSGYLVMGEDELKIFEVLGV